MKNTTDSYCPGGGTSDAAPVVTGVAALIFSARPDLDGLTVKNIILGKVTKVPSLHGKIKSVGKLYQEKKYAEAAEILENALTQFPDNLHSNTYNLALVYIQLNQAEKAIKTLEYGSERGVWYGKYDFIDEIWAPLKAVEGFDSFDQKNEAKKKEAQKEVKPRLEVFVPENYDKGRKYPLFIALHGGGENIEGFKPRWTSDRLKNEFIVAYPQSSQIITMNGFNWAEDIELTKKEIKEAYEKIIKSYAVATSQVIIGGFSSGGVASLEVVLDNTIPVAGFVVLCPARPEDFTAEKVRAAMERGIRGFLITTEMDNRLPDQKKMDGIMNEHRLPHEFIVTPNVGHWYPDNLAEMIDAAIAFILKGTVH
jgi:predicted esterase